MPALTSLDNKLPAILCLGPAKTGKTVLFSRFKVPNKISMIIDADNNLRAVINQAQKESRDISHIECESVHFDDMGGMIQPLAKFQRLAALCKRISARADIGAVAFTSTTALNQIFQDEVRRQCNRAEGTPLTQPEWGKYGYLWSKFVMDTRLMGKLIFYDGHVETQQDEVTKSLRYAFALPGKSSDLVPSMFTDVWRTSVAQELKGDKYISRYLVHTSQDSRHPNYGTSLDLPAQFENTQPTIDKIMTTLLKS